MLKLDKSLDNAIKLHKKGLITTNTKDFQNLAIDIATDKSKLKKIKDDLNN